MNLYGIEKRNTIESSPLVIGDRDYTSEYCHENNLHYVTCADVPGYMTIEYWVTRDDIHKRLTGESEVKA